MELVILASLCIIAILYSSVGHGGASGYLAVLSLTMYGTMDSAWLKQHVWFLNLIVAGIAFGYYRRFKFHNYNLTWPFVIASVPFAFIGGYLHVNGVIYDTLLSITLIWAAYKLYKIQGTENYQNNIPSLKITLPIGGFIGLLSGIIGVGGGIFLSPILLINGWGSPKVVAATSALFIWVNSASGLLGATISKQLIVDFEIILPFGLAVIIGGLIGSYYGSKLAPQKTVKSVLIGVLLIASMKRIFEIIN